ncbi:anthranilate/para-aminobenzoate synthase component I [Bradyrhizobium sp. cir1]|nr:anthranilate/para-aminobenzoate synthase component I [Bradyrhizobium sp. cir1]
MLDRFYWLAGARARTSKGTCALSSRRVCGFAYELKPAAESLPRQGGAWKSNFSRDAYVSAVKRVDDFILAGDVFQVNTARRFSAKLPSCRAAELPSCRAAELPSCRAAELI